MISDRRSGGEQHRCGENLYLLVGESHLQHRQHAQQIVLLLAMAIPAQGLTVKIQAAIYYEALT